jgi:Predicted metal-binding integral membrane protein (DUF2182)
VRAIVRPLSRLSRLCRFARPARAAAPHATATLLLGGSALAWAWLVHLQWFAGFDPGSLDNLCRGWGAPLSASVVNWLGAAQSLLIDGALMVLAMMLPVAVVTARHADRASRPCACMPARAMRLSPLWTAGYLLAWGAALIIVVMVMLSLAGAGWFGAQAPWVRAAPAVLAAAACALEARAALQRRDARSGAAPRVGPPNASLQGGWRSGAACVARCAVPMLALHAVYGMSVVAMATYAGLVAWQAAGASRLAHAVAAGALLASAVAAA